LEDYQALWSFKVLSVTTKLAVLIFTILAGFYACFCAIWLVIMCYAALTGQTEFQQDGANFSLHSNFNQDRQQSQEGGEFVEFDLEQDQVVPIPLTEDGDNYQAI
jgi:hypothetical protein